MWWKTTSTPILLLTLATSGCNRFEPEEYAPFTPTAQFRAWWNETESCAGHRGDFGRVRWFIVPGETFDCPGGRCAGRWESNHRIYISEAWIGHEMVVRHEMLHDILNGGSHPAHPFVTPCGLTWAAWRGAGSVVRSARGTWPGLD